MEAVIESSKTLTADQFHASRKLVDTDFGRIAYVERGEGPLALFVHGALLNGFQWRHQLAALGDLRRSIAVDVMAMGYSEIEPGTKVGLREQAEMLASFLDGLGLEAGEQIDLVGNDSGGGTAQVFAALHPERVRTLTLINCEVNDFDDQGPGFVKFRELVESGGLPALLRAGLQSPSAARAALGTAYEHPERLSDETIEVYFSPLVSSEERVAQLHAFVTESPKAELLALEERVRRIPAPVLVLWGTADSFFRIEDAHWLRDNLPNVVNVVEVEGASLFWPEERPEVLSAELRELWTRYAPASR